MDFADGHSANWRVVIDETSEGVRVETRFPSTDVADRQIRKPYHRSVSDYLVTLADLRKPRSGDRERKARDRRGCSVICGLETTNGGITVRDAGGRVERRFDQRRDTCFPVGGRQVTKR